MFDFGNANEFQKKAIETVDGPLLLIAGPGTGKTFTLVQRTLYLIQEKGVAPDQIFIATFTEKAAKELVTRITDELSNRGISVNLNEMYVGTFHSICLRILKENLVHTRIKKNFRVLDQFDQQYSIFQNIQRFKKIPGYNLVISNRSKWKQAKQICYYVNHLSEEMVDWAQMQQDPNENIKFIGHLLEKYSSYLNELNCLDFSSIQVETYNLLQSNPEILRKIQEQVRYIMIDEYQDTNHIQEQLIFLIGGQKQNICVVGDDDQGLYRFRGATIQNILEFPDKFNERDCKKILLTTNYRSNSQIVDFYNHWMKRTSGSKFRFSWEGKYRFEKDIIADDNHRLNYPTVLQISGPDELEENWHYEILNFIRMLKKSGKLTDYNQIAFLFKSVKNQKVISLAEFLEKNGIRVYSPRSGMFFQRPEVMGVLGCLILMFPTYLDFMDPGKAKIYFEKLIQYYTECIKIASDIIKKNPKLMSWIHESGVAHMKMEKNTDYGFTGLFYHLLAFSPFREFLDSDLSGTSADLRAQRNLSLLSQILSKYDYLHQVNVITKKSIRMNVEMLFSLYLRLLYEGGISEYEDEAEYAPSGCVSFLTIHQSKGLEFPIVIVGVENVQPRNGQDELLEKIEKTYFKREQFEPAEQIKFFDFWRLFYTAYSRAQNLLVLTSRKRDGKGKQPNMYFADIYDHLPEYSSTSINLREYEFMEVKAVNLKETYSFTSHILLYENCSLQYKFFKELEFTPSRYGQTIFGVIVHQTIEDVHKAALRDEAETITKENVEKWLRLNYETASRRDHSYLGEKEIQYAIDQVQRYVEREKSLYHDWSHIFDAEVNVGLVKENYILEGTIDLIKGEGNTVDIVDFKAEKKPNLRDDVDRLNTYQQQLQVYAHLVEERTDLTVGKLHLYYTGTEDGIPTITFDKNQESIDETIQTFDAIVAKIQRKDFSQTTNSTKLCENCDFRYYCKQ